MKIKTSELVSPALDWAVAKADNQLKYITFHFELTHPLVVSGVQSYGPSFIWSQGGPIVEREEISSEHKFFPNGWECRNGRNAFARGPTVLVAAMRCFVASKLGDEIDVPEELLS